MPQKRVIVVVQDLKLHVPYDDENTIEWLQKECQARYNKETSQQVEVESLVTVDGS